MQQLNRIRERDITASVATAESVRRKVFLKYLVTQRESPKISRRKSLHTTLIDVEQPQLHVGIEVFSYPKH